MQKLLWRGIEQKLDPSFFMNQKKHGRPSKFSQEIANEICNRIELGESLRTICNDEHLPERQTIRLWLIQKKDFCSQYARSREIQQDSYAEEILEIADNGTNDWMEREGKVLPDHEHINRSRLRVDTRKWLMSKLAPKKYGDKITQELTGKDGGELVVNVNLSPKKDEN